MENILQNFNKKITTLMENYLKNLIFENGISKFTDDLVKEFAEFTNIGYEILSEEMKKSVRERKEKLMMYIINNIEGITNLYKNKEILNGCSAEGHVSHIFSARMSSRPIGWKTENVNNMSKLRLCKAVY